MAQPSSSGVMSTAGFYRRWLGPVLAKDEGIDAEQLSRAALQALGQAPRYPCPCGPQKCTKIGSDAIERCASFRTGSTRSVTHTPRIASSTKEKA